MRDMNERDDMHQSGGSIGWFVLAGGFAFAAVFLIGFNQDSTHVADDTHVASAASQNDHTEPTIEVISHTVTGEHSDSGAELFRFEIETGHNLGRVVHSCDSSELHISKLGGEDHQDDHGEPVPTALEASAIEMYCQGNGILIGLEPASNLMVPDDPHTSEG